jgi:hypothetical protein
MQGKAMQGTFGFVPFLEVVRAIRKYTGETNKYIASKPTDCLSTLPSIFPRDVPRLLSHVGARLCKATLARRLLMAATS